MVNPNSSLRCKEMKMKQTIGHRVLLVLCIVATFVAYVVDVTAFSVVAPIGSVRVTSIVQQQQQQQQEQVIRHTSSWRLSMAGMSQPEVETKTKTKTTTVTTQKQKRKQKQKAQTDEPETRREDDFQEAPMYKLMLLADNGYDPEHVILRMCAVVEDLDEDAASTIFQQAQQNGKAMCGKYPFERAELYKEQLLRSNPMIFSEMEDDQ
jgi:ATP-dependent Clp protease adapter protein ClpS